MCGPKRITTDAASDLWVKNSPSEPSSKMEMLVVEE
jgi:hypothetical protein